MLKKKKKEIIDKIIEDRIIRSIRTFFEQEGDDEDFKPKRLSNFWNNNYIEYKSSGDRNKNLSLDEYLNKIEPYSRDIIIAL